MLLVSACLAGCDCRYNGGNCADESVVALVRSGQALPLCPEQLAGEPTPRAPHEIIVAEDGSKRIIDAQGHDATDAYALGAARTLAVCQALGIKKAILKSNSPSCGRGLVYDGSFTGRLVSGNGFTAALLKENGIDIKTAG